MEIQGANGQTRGLCLQHRGHQRWTWSCAHDDGTWSKPVEDLLEKRKGPDPPIHRFHSWNIQASQTRPLSMTNWETCQWQVSKLWNPIQVTLRSGGGTGSIFDTRSFHHGVLWIRWQLGHVGQIRLLALHDARSCSCSRMVEVLAGSHDGSHTACVARHQGEGLHLRERENLKK